MTDRATAERVVITGMGAITPTGLDMPTTWDNVRRGRSGIRPITLFDASPFQVTIAGEAHGFDPASFMTPKQIRRTDRNVQLAIAAAIEAVQHAELEIGPSNAFDTGVIVGNGAGGIWTYTRENKVWESRGGRAISPLLIPMMIPDAAGVQVAMVFGARGPNYSVSSACTTGLDAIGTAMGFLRRGEANVMLAGGTEAAVHELGILGFDRLGALARGRNDDPEGASRPFDAARAGFVLSEGSVVLVLETLEHARSRGAEPLAEILSYAATSDAVHLTAPDPGGHGAIECMRRAIERSGVGTDDIEYVNAHAPGTPVGDPIEANALAAIFGERTVRVPVSSTKSSTGHLLGAAGSIAVALTACALRDGFLPPTINLDDPDPACRLGHVRKAAEPTRARYALVPSYGFGGHNSCVVVAGAPED